MSGLPSMSFVMVVCSFSHDPFKTIDMKLLIIALFLSRYVIKKILMIKH